MTHNISRKRLENASGENEEHIQPLFEHAPIGIASFDSEGNWTYVNKTFAQIIGCTPDEAVGVNYKDVIPREEWEMSADYIRKLMAGELPRGERERRITRKDGSTVWVRINGKVMREAEDACYGIAVLEDITELRRTQQLLEESNKRFKKVFSASPLAMVISVMEDGHILEVSDTFLGLMGQKREDVIGRTSIELGMWADPADRATSVDLLRSQNSMRNFETTIRTKSGDLREALLSAQVIDLDGRPSILTTLLDITERNKVDGRLKAALDYSCYLASRDPLTGLPNRAHFADQLKSALAHAKREGYAVALHLLDLNKFKSINDTYGHPVGDLLLKEVAHRIATHIRETDTAARLGGDEFAVIQTHLNRPEDAELFAKKLVRVLKNTSVLDGNEVMGAACAGVAIFPNDAKNYEQLIKTADAALYKAKNTGWLCCRNESSFLSTERNG